MPRIIDVPLGKGVPPARRRRDAARASSRGLAYSPEVRAATDELYPLVKDHITPMEWPEIAPLVHAIGVLKRERNAVVLAHNYMTTDIYRLAGDLVGDSLQLARGAAQTGAQVIVQAGVSFMAETSKILCPDRTVLLPDMAAGCSLAESITAEDVRAVRRAYPGLPVVTYVNTSAAVKAESDITCTSSNAVDVVEHVARLWGVSRVILLPDEFLARNVAANTPVGIIAWKGRCEVHERFSAEDVEQIRLAYPGVVVLAHPECPPDVLAAADFAGSTSALTGFVQSKSPPRVALLTECSMSDNVASETLGVEFIRPCNLCPHMKRITLERFSP